MTPDPPICAECKEPLTGQDHECHKHQADDATATLIALAGVNLIPVVWRPWQNTTWWTSDEVSVVYHQKTRLTGEILWYDPKSRKRYQATFKTDFKNLRCIAEQIAAEKALLPWEDEEDS